MIARRAARNRRWKRSPRPHWPAVPVAACLALSLVACSSSAQPDGHQPAGAVSAKIGQLLAPANKFVAPGPALDTKTLAGKSLWFVPVSAEIPVLAVELKALQDAARALKMPLQVCDGKLSPPAEAACINSAVSAGAAGIFTDGVDPHGVQTAVDNAASHNVPILSMGEVGTDTGNLKYFDVGDTASQAAAAEWIIADSAGKANVLITENTDDPGASHNIEAGSKDTFSRQCPGCQVTVAGFTTGTTNRVGTLTSSALLRDHQIGYALANFDFLIPQMVSGARTAVPNAQLKFVGIEAALSSMQLVKSGGQAADGAANRNYGGWAAMDAMLRILLGKPAPVTNFLPVRVFDKTNIDSVGPLTNDNALNGSWFGPVDYPQQFQQLWGIDG
ncbi:sugar ABC transporter substrate-binding protein [Amycolatopsis pithecellobii]|uniref:Substrate-binding domain-containing protein n=1 Tax=Amycolatopsis pithecellobii TaxID=664692 RepID=A0A6N7Z127_9PSEU|nr:substrate-binding domain-containing protein [Amycolatopsis pithecellobii]MTD53204.1 substrate-binding domain-containing protein [Amycolatopsis pithecellobii]